MKPGKSVAIMTPAYMGQVHVDYARSVANAMFLLAERGWEVMWLHYGNVASVTKARNALVCDALARGASELVFIDGDLAFDATALERLLSHDLDLVAGCQRIKVDGPFPYAVMPLRNDEGKDVFTLRDGVAEVAAVPTAFMRLRRAAVIELMRHSEELKYHDEAVFGSDEYLYALFNHALFDHPNAPGKRKYHGEDYAFCHLWREYGFRVHADLSIPLTHIRQVALSGTAIEGLLVERKVQAAT